MKTPNLKGQKTETLPKLRLITGCLLLLVLTIFNCKQDDI
ncbi:hypothetical protein LX78_00644 [Xanthomarina spongicola]|uniref:Uncharacterized protein n=1 Tax=Xanthomarina spongicola TaxID=570520 RepID=A0A316DRM8_9FLAO|nr:hypothetical protein LX78_00644 [Xanthomarina spongicola]